MTNEALETAQMRSITIEIPTIIAQKMAETFEGTLEDATLTGLRLLHGMGIAAYTQLQAIAKQREISVAKAMREAVAALETAITAGKPGSGAIGRPKINEARDIAIYNSVTNGNTYAEVSAAFGISLVRVGQIVAQQRAMRGITPKADIAARNAEIVRRVDAGENRHDVATSYGITRGVVDNVMAMHRAANPKAIPEMPAKAAPEPEVLSLKEPEAAEPTQPTAPTEQPAAPAKPRFVMPTLEAMKAKQAEPVDTRTAIERDVYNPEFGF